MREGEGDSKANHSILDAVDRQTGSSLLLEVMASRMIKHVNRSHNHHRTEGLPKKKMSMQPCAKQLGSPTQIQPSVYRQPNPDRTRDRQTQTRKASVWPQHISLHYCQRCASVSPALLLIPSAWCTEILTACLSIPPSQPPRPWNLSMPQCLLWKSNTKRKIPQSDSLWLAPSPLVQRKTPHRQETEQEGRKKNPIRWKSEEIKKKIYIKLCSCTDPSPVLLCVCPLSSFGLMMLS